MEHDTDSSRPGSRAAARERADATERALRPGKVLGAIRDAADGPFRETAQAPDLLVFEHQDEWRAVARKCPHYVNCPERQLDLADFGKIVGGEIHCHHKGHRWSCATGQPTGRFSDAPMVIAPVRIGPDGIATIPGDPEAAETEST